MELNITGQLKSGKNHMGITRTGKRYPLPAWAEWRDGVLLQIKAQLPCRFQPFDKPVSVDVDYLRSDNRRRDVPGMMDAMWHCLERSGVLKDDALAEDVRWTCIGHDKHNPGAKVSITEKPV